MSETREPYSAVRKCAICKKDFWSEDGDDDHCESCADAIQREFDAVVEQKEPKEMAQASDEFGEWAKASTLRVRQEVEAIGEVDFTVRPTGYRSWCEIWEGLVELFEQAHDRGISATLETVEAGQQDAIREAVAQERAEIVAMLRLRAEKAGKIAHERSKSEIGAIALARHLEASDMADLIEQRGE